MALGDRRHHEERIKSRWRRRFARQKALAVSPERHARWQERMALLRAHHSKCCCGQCKLRMPSEKHPDVRVRNWAGEMD